MRLHTKLDYIDVAHALESAKRDGHVTRDVTFVGGLKPYGSRTHARAFEAQLGTYEKDSLPAGYRDQYGKLMHVRRFKNTGDRGASSEYYGDCGAVWAATWDEWGWFIAYVFAADPDARFGHYESYAGFMAQTNGKFDLEPTPEKRPAAEENLDYLPAREHDRRAFGGLLPGEDYSQYDSAGEDVRFNRVVEDMRRVQRNLDEDRVNHDTVREQTGEDA